MRVRQSSWLMSLSILSCTTVNDGRLETALDEMVATERAFSDHSALHGMRAAFLEYIGEGIVFRPTPVSANESFADQPDTPGTLTWEPMLAGVAYSGDFGYSTGPWVYRAVSEDGVEAVAHGQFLTVWTRRDDGSWRAAIDHGVRHAAPSTQGSELQRILPTPPARSTSSVSAQDSAHVELLSYDRDMGAEVDGGDLATVYQRWLTEDARVLRDGTFPATGSEALPAAVEGLPSNPLWQPQGGAVAGSGDLGYTYGIIRSNRESSDADGAAGYLRIWKRSGTDWRIAIDVASPLPPGTGN